MASSSADLIAYFVNEMVKRGIPAVTPPGGLAGHVDAMKFIPHVPQSAYPAGALTAAIYLISGARGMERGTISMDRDAQGNDVPSDVELCRLAVPRRVYTVSHIDYVVDRLAWLLAHRDLIGRAEVHPRTARVALLHRPAGSPNDWGTRLAAAYEADFGAVAELSGVNGSLLFFVIMKKKAAASIRFDSGRTEPSPMPQFTTADAR